MLRTHRQRVPAMLAVACAGMMVYAVAGAATDDGRALAPAETTAPAAKSGSSTTTTAKDGKSSGTSDDCKSTTSTTSKDGDGKDGDGKSTTTSTTSKDGDGKGDSDSTPTTVNEKDVSTKAAVKGDTTATTAKGDSKDGCDSTTSTTRKSGDGKGTTTTTRKSGDGKDGDGKNSTTTTTDRKDRPTTTTEKPDTVEPTTPSGGDPGSSGGSDSGGTADPGATPIEPQEAPPYDPSYDQPVDDPGAADPGWYEMPDEGPVAMDEEYDPIEPMAAPGEAQPVIPTFSGRTPRSGGKASATSDRSSRLRSGRNQELAAPPLVMSSSGAVQASTGSSQSASVSKTLGGLQHAVAEVAFPADIISTPKIFPVNRRDPLAAAALVLLVGVSRELFKAWRRRASDFWPA